MKIYWPKWQQRGPVFQRMRLLKTKRVRVALNRLVPDIKGTLPHDHGCDFFSLVVWGDYLEDLYPDARGTKHSLVKRRWLTCHVMRNSAAHRIETNRPGTITLFITWKFIGRGPMVFHPDGTTQDFIAHMREMIAA
jgi:hypothetical protein